MLKLAADYRQYEARAASLRELSFLFFVCPGDAPVAITQNVA